MTAAVSVFKTNVRTEAEVERLALGLSKLGEHWNFDLDDCDKILRVRGNNSAQVISLLLQEGFLCEEL